MKMLTLSLGLATMLLASPVFAATAKPAATTAATVKPMAHAATKPAHHKKKAQVCHYKGRKVPCAHSKTRTHSKATHKNTAKPAKKK
jgi:hypothetical protein